MDYDTGIIAIFNTFLSAKLLKVNGIRIFSRNIENARCRIFYDFRDESTYFPKIISTPIYASIVASTNSPRVEAICRDINYDGNSIGARPPCKEGDRPIGGIIETWTALMNFQSPIVRTLLYRAGFDLHAWFATLRCPIARARPDYITN